MKYWNWRSYSLVSVLLTIDLRMIGTLVPSELVDCVTDEFCAGVTDILTSIETDEFDTCVTDAISVCVTDRLEVADNVSLGVTNNPCVWLAAMEWFTEFSLTDADGLTEGLGNMRELPATVSLTEKQLKPKPLTHLNCHVLYLNLARTKSSRVTHLANVRNDSFVISSWWKFYTYRPVWYQILVFHTTGDLKKEEQFFDDKLPQSSVVQRPRDEAILFVVMERKAAVAYHSCARNILSNLLPIRRFGRDISKIRIWILCEKYTWLQWIALSILWTTGT